jgi:hypothetical protein
VDIRIPDIMMTFFVFRCFLPLEHIDIDVRKLSHEGIGCLLDRESLRSLRSFKVHALIWSGDVTKFLNVLNFVQAQELHELYISGDGSEPLASWLISISPNLNSLFLGALDISQIIIYHNHLSSLTVYFVGQRLPQLVCPNLTRLSFVIEHPVFARGTNNVPLKVELLVLEYDDNYLDDIKEIVSFYDLGSSVKCLMAHSVNPPNQVREEIVELFPNLQSWHNSGLMTFRTVRKVVNNFPDLKRVYCVDPTIVTKPCKKLLKKNGIIMAHEDSIDICKFCHQVHTWG